VLNFDESFRAIGVRHFYVNDSQIRLGAFHRADDFQAVGSLSNHFDAGDIFEQCADPIAHQVMVIGNYGSHFLDTDDFVLVAFATALNRDCALKKLSERQITQPS